ncbi:MAG: dipeptidase [Chloroflexota bacterium]
MNNWESYLANNQDRFLEELKDFLRIPSISSLPEHTQDVMEAGQWVADRMKQAGIENIEILPTEGHPVVYGDWLHAPGKPTVLIYGHFDVQPVDPLELWENPPFEPVVKDGRIYARGATDDKGNMLTPILAVEALMQTEDKLPINLKFLFEGQEEIGSPHLPPFMEKEAARFACDLVVSSDGGQMSEEQPVLLVGTKGLAALEIHITGAKSDLHSGMYGGTIQNPIHALANIIAKLRDDNGKILVDGFYDDVRDLSEEDRELISAVPYDNETFINQIGVNETFGEPGYTTVERRFARPTLELNGIWGGFQGDGVKTVLPSEAHAKITCRLVANQHPAKIRDLLQAYIEKVAPPGVSVNVVQQKNQALPYLMENNHPANMIGGQVLTELYGVEPIFVRTGGSVPIYELFDTHLNRKCLTFAFGLSDENLHAPNEFFRLSSFEKAQKGYCKLIHALSNFQQ